LSPKLFKSEKIKNWVKYDTPPYQKFRYDLLYIKNQSFLLDLKLIFLSFYITFRGRWESRERKV